MKVDGKVAIVTGGSSGLGQAITRRLVQDGARVVMCYHSGKLKAEKAKEDIDKSGKNVVLFGGDLSDESTVEALFSKTREVFGSPPSILVNCAGGPSVDKPLADGVLNDWETVFAANLYSTVLCTKAAVGCMEKGGKIVNIGSVLGEEYGGREGIPAYSASKAAVHNFSQTIAKQLVPDILVNVVSPGRTITDYYDKFDKKTKKELGDANKIERWIQPEEIADAVMFVVGNDALVGEVISVNGGFFFG